MEDRLARAARLAHRSDDFSDSESSVATSAVTTDSEEKEAAPPASPPPPVVTKPQPPKKPKKNPNTPSPRVVQKNTTMNISDHPTPPKELPPVLPLQDEGELILLSDEDEIIENRRQRASLSVSPSLAWELSLRSSSPPSTRRQRPIPTKVSSFPAAGHHDKPRSRSIKMALPDKDEEENDDSVSEFEEDSDLRALLRKYEELVVKHHRLLKEAAARQNLELQALELEREIERVQADISTQNRQFGGTASSLPSFRF